MRWRPSRTLLLVIIGGFSTLLYLQDFTIATYPWVFLPLFGLYGCAVGVVFRKPSGSTPAGLAMIIGFAVPFRCIVLCSPLLLSSDLSPYAWNSRPHRAAIHR